MNTEPTLWEKIIYKLNHPTTDLGYLLRFGWIRRLTMEVEDISWSIDTSDSITRRALFPEYKNGLKHETSVFYALKSRLKNHTIFFDIGANVGIYSVFVGLCCPDGKIHSFEMDPELIPLIKKNLELNNLKNTNIICAAVSNHQENIVTFRPHNAKPNIESKTHNQITNSTEMDYPVFLPELSIDKYCEYRDIHPDIVKIDVEGAERFVLDGMKKTLKIKTPILILEVHVNHLDKYNSSVQQILNLLNEFDYDVKQIEDHRNTENTQPKLRDITVDNLKHNVIWICTP